jgi:uncharacterized protein (DUF2252 family)
LSSPLTHSDRRALGIRARQQLARSGHASFSATACPHSPLDLLRQSERDRIPHLLAIKHARMAASPFGFFRGAVPVMAADLACHPNTGLTTQICGDAHASNLGAYAGPMAGLGGAALKDAGVKDARVKAAGLVFDINDFDETLHGPFEYDLKRLATSLILAGREAGVRRSGRRDAVLHFAQQYRRLMHEFASMPVLELARYQIHRMAEIDPMPAILRQAERATPQKSLKNLTEPVPSLTKSGAPNQDCHQDSAKRDNGGRRSEASGSASTTVISTGASRSHRDAEPPPPGCARVFRSEPPLLTRLAPAEAATVLASLTLYERTLQPERRHFLAQYTPQDVAFKVVGTGSIGLRDYCIYFEGSGGFEGREGSSRREGSGGREGSSRREGSGGREGSTWTGLAHHDPLFLQIKEEPASAYAPYLPDGDAHTHQGHRVMDGQRAMQLTSDPFLGYTTIPDERGQPRDYLVRQLNDHKATLDLKALNAASLLGYADLCGELFARGHARAGDPVAIAAYLGNSDRFDHALLSFARAYADKTEKDWAAFKKSLKQP